MAATPKIRAFFDEPTNTVSYLVSDPQTAQAAIVDPVLDYDHRTGKASTKSADAILAAADGLRIDWVLETHAHADHLSGAGVVTLLVGSRKTLQRTCPSSRSGHRLPRPHRLAAKLAKCLTGDEMTLAVKGLVDGGVC